jgi:uncharacterized protein
VYRAFPFPDVSVCYRIIRRHNVGTQPEKTEDLAAIRKIMEDQKAAKEKKDKLAAVNTIANFMIIVGVLIIGIVLLITFWK